MNFTDHDYFCNETIDNGIDDLIGNTYDDADTDSSDDMFDDTIDFMDLKGLDYDEACIDLFGGINDLDGYEDAQSRGDVREINMNFLYVATMDGLPFPIYAFIRRLSGKEVTFSVFDSEHPSREDWDNAGFFTLRDSDFLECFKPVGYVHYRID